jgi:hypothetical protein
VKLYDKDVGADAGQDNISLLASHELRQLKCGYVMRRLIADTPGREKARSEPCTHRTHVRLEGPMRHPKATRTDLTAPTDKFRVVAVVVDVDSADPYIVGDFGLPRQNKLPCKERASGALCTSMTTRQSYLCDMEAGTEWR